MDAAQQQRKITDFDANSATTNLDQKVVKTELPISSFLFEHNFPSSTADHTAKLFSRNMFPDSKIVNKYQCGCTKTADRLTRAVAEQITSNLKEELLLTWWYGLATDGSSNKDDKLLPVLAGHVYKDSGLIATSLLWHDKY